MGRGAGGAEPAGSNVRPAAHPLVREFTHLILEDEFWAQNWQKIQVDDRSLVYDSSGVYFQGTDAEGFVYLTAPLATTELLWEDVRAAIA